MVQVRSRRPNTAQRQMISVAREPYRYPVGETTLKAPSFLKSHPSPAQE